MSLTHAYNSQENHNECCIMWEGKLEEKLRLITKCKLVLLWNSCVLSHTHLEITSHLFHHIFYILSFKNFLKKLTIPNNFLFLNLLPFSFFLDPTFLLEYNTWSLPSVPSLSPATVEHGHQTDTACQFP